MKQLKYVFCIAIAGIVFSSCKKESIDNYDGTDNIYFTSNYNNKIDTGAVSFGYALPIVTDSVIKIPVSIMGSIATTDRPYKVTIVDTSTAIVGKHYDPLQSSYAISAGKNVDTLRIKLRRTTDLQTTAVTLILQLQPNENFKTTMKTKVTNSNTGAYYSFVTYKLSINDFLTQPKFWLTAYSGIFSRKKIILMSQVLGVSIADISNNSSIPQQIYWARTMQLYLNDQKNNGNIIYEDDGITPMAMGPSVQ